MVKKNKNLGLIIGGVILLSAATYFIIKKRSKQNLVPLPTPETKQVTTNVSQGNILGDVNSIINSLKGLFTPSKKSKVIVGATEIVPTIVLTKANTILRSDAGDANTAITNYTYSGKSLNVLNSKNVDGYTWYNVIDGVYNGWIKSTDVNVGVAL